MLPNKFSLVLSLLFLTGLVFSQGCILKNTVEIQVDVSLVSSIISNNNFGTVTIKTSPTISNFVTLTVENYLDESGSTYSANYSSSGDNLNINVQKNVNSVSSSNTLSVNENIMFGVGLLAISSHYKLTIPFIMTAYLYLSASQVEAQNNCGVNLIITIPSHINILGMEYSSGSLNNLNIQIKKPNPRYLSITSNGITNYIRTFEGNQPVSRFAECVIVNADLLYDFSCMPINPMLVSNDAIQMLGYYHIPSKQHYIIFSVTEVGLSNVTINNFTNSDIGIVDFNLNSLSSDSYYIPNGPESFSFSDSNFPINGSLETGIFTFKGGSSQSFAISLPYTVNPSVTIYTYQTSSLSMNLLGSNNQVSKLSLTDLVSGLKSINLTISWSYNNPNQKTLSRYVNNTNVVDYNQFNTANSTVYVSISENSDNGGIYLNNTYISSTLTFSVEEDFNDGTHRDCSFLFFQGRNYEGSVSSYGSNQTNSNTPSIYIMVIRGQHSNLINIVGDKIELISGSISLDVVWAINYLIQSGSRGQLKRSVFGHCVDTAFGALGTVGSAVVTVVGAVATIPSAGTSTILTAGGAASTISAGYFTVSSAVCCYNPSHSGC